LFFLPRAQPPFYLGGPSHNPFNNIVFPPPEQQFPPADSPRKFHHILGRTLTPNFLQMLQVYIVKDIIILLFGFLGTRHED
jgi:hypothetical protein